MPVIRKIANPTEILEKIIIDYGRFADGYNYLDGLFSSKFNGSLILRGLPGVGKKSLVSIVTKQNCIKDIILSPFQHKDDFAAMKTIAKSLGLSSKVSTSEMLEQIRTALEHSNQKVVIVLEDLEQFCRQNQSLLYNLTTLCQHGRNICLVGITASYTCLDNLEKRVRSRLSSLTYDLRAPYSNVNEFIEFASILLDCRKIRPDLKKELIYIYRSGRRSIRDLKLFLSRVAVERGDTSETDLFIDQSSFIERFSRLTKPQQELAKMVCFYCSVCDTTYFNLKQVEEFMKKHNETRFDSSCLLMLKNAKVLAESCIFIVVDRHYRGPIGNSTKFCVDFAPFELKLLALNEEFRSIKTDPILKRI